MYPPPVRAVLLGPLHPLAASWAGSRCPAMVCLPGSPGPTPIPHLPGDWQMGSPAPSSCSVADLRRLLPLLAPSCDKAVPIASPPAAQPAAEGASSECGPGLSCPTLSFLPLLHPHQLPHPLAGTVAGAAGGKAKDQTGPVSGAHGPQVSPAVVPGMLLAWALGPPLILPLSVC